MAGFETDWPDPGTTDRWVLRRMAVMGPEVAAEYERQMSRRAGTL